MCSDKNNHFVWYTLRTNPALSPVQLMLQNAMRFWSVIYNPFLCIFIIPRSYRSIRSINRIFRIWAGRQPISASRERKNARVSFLHRLPFKVVADSSSSRINGAPLTNKLFSLYLVRMLVFVTLLPMKLCYAPGGPDWASLSLCLNMAGVRRRKREDRGQKTAVRHCGEGRNPGQMQ